MQQCIHLLLCVFPLISVRFQENKAYRFLGAVFVIQLTANTADEGQSTKRLAHLIMSRRYCKANETRVETC